MLLPESKYACFSENWMYDSEVKNRLNFSVYFIFKNVFSVLHPVAVTG